MAAPALEVCGAAGSMPAAHGFRLVMAFALSPASPLLRSAASCAPPPFPSMSLPFSVLVPSLPSAFAFFLHESSLFRARSLSGLPFPFLHLSEADALTMAGFLLLLEIVNNNNETKKRAFQSEGNL